ncbi:MAG: DsrE family protein [Tissierellales bacterium]|nr:DsrE family protein [Tissierellales bacterium]
METQKKELVVLWTDDNITTVENMIFMYTYNAKKKKWWDEVTLIIWGSSTDLTAKNIEIQNKIKKMIEKGIKVRACKACAENLNAVKTLEDLGVDVLYIGEDLTEYLKNDKYKVLSL